MKSARSSVTIASIVTAVTELYLERLRGAKISEIAAQLGCTTRTVSNHLRQSHCPPELEWERQWVDSRLMAVCVPTRDHLRDLILEARVRASRTSEWATTEHERIPQDGGSGGQM